MGGALTRLRNRQLSAAFEKWQAVAAGLKTDQAPPARRPCGQRTTLTVLTIPRDQARLGGALQRMVQRALSAAFEKWQAEAAAEGAAKGRMAQAVRGMVQATLTPTLTLNPPPHTHPLPPPKLQFPAPKLQLPASITPTNSKQYKNKISKHIHALRRDYLYDFLSRI
jgi:hypothetical protein